MKRVFSAVLALALVFSTFGIVVSANTDKAVITITEETVATRESDGVAIKKLVFNATTPAGAKLVKSTNAIFSWDSTKVTPVRTDKADYPDLTTMSASGIGRTVKAFSDNDLIDFTATCTLVNSGDRYGVQVSTTNTDGWDATTGMVFTEFYYRVNTGATPDGDTFKVEFDPTAGSILRLLMPNEAASDLAGIDVGGYKYGNADTSIADTATLAEFSWTGSEPTETEADISTITIEGATEVKLPAALNLTLGGTTPEGVTAELQYEIDGVWGTTVPTAAGTYNVKVVATAAEGYVITGTAATATVTILAADPVEETKDLSANGAATLTTENAIYEDLCIVDAVIAHGLEAGKTIVKWGVRFHDAANINVGGGLVEFTPETTEVTIEGGELTFKAAIIGVPDGVTVTAVPFVVSK